MAKYKFYNADKLERAVAKVKAEGGNPNDEEAVKAWYEKLQGKFDVLQPKPVEPVEPNEQDEDEAPKTRKTAKSAKGPKGLELIDEENEGDDDPTKDDEIKDKPKRKSTKGK